MQYFEIIYKFAVVLQSNTSFNDLEHRCRKLSRKMFAWMHQLGFGLISVEFLAPGVSAGHCHLLINMLKEQVLHNLMESKHLTCTPKVLTFSNEA